MKNLNQKTAFVLCAVLLLNAALLFSLYHRTWAPHEDGYFANVAERLLQGEKLYRDVESRHAGYIHFVNASAMALWGHTVAVPRIPVILLTILQSGILFLLFLPSGVLPAVLAALITTVLGYLQCLTPSTHWYCLFLLILMVVVLLKIPRGKAIRFPLLGFLLGLIILFRQLTGFFAAAGLLCYLLTEDSIPEEETGTPVLARILILLASALLVLNFIETFEINGFLLFGLWPCFLILWAFFHTRLSNREAWKMGLRLGAGLLLAFLPLLIYLVINGAFFLWVDDAIIRPSKVLQTTPYESWSSFAIYQIGGALQVIRHQSLSLVLNGIYWFFLPLLSFLNGALIFTALLNRKKLSGKDILPLMAVFYSIVSYTLQIPIYLYYSATLSLISLLWITNNYFPKLVLPVTFLSLFLLGTGFYYQAAQPCQRGTQGMLEGERQILTGKESMPKLGLKMLPLHADIFEEVVDYIKKQTSEKDTLLVFPSDPEIYFLSDRKNPFRFTFTPAALQSPKDLEEVLKQFQAHPPKMVIYNPEDKYNTPLALQLLEEIKKSYSLKKTIRPFEIYEKA